MPLALALPGREVRVDEEVAPEAPIMLVPKAEPLSMREVIELSNDKLESLTPSIAAAALPAAPIISTTPIISIAHVIPDVPRPSVPFVSGSSDIS